MNQSPGQESKPVLLRAGTLLTAVDASEPSLTVVEFTDSIGLMLAEGLQQDGYSGKLFLEAVQFARSICREWRTAEYQQVCFDGTACSALLKATHLWDEIATISTEFGPLIIFVAQREFARLEVALEQRRFETLFRLAHEKARDVPKLDSRLRSVRVRNLARIQEAEELSAPTKKATTRISLPPNAMAKETVRLELPPKPIPPPTAKKIYPHVRTPERRPKPPPPAE